jgi:myosin-crossreactive antigen
VEFLIRDSKISGNKVTLLVIPAVSSGNLRGTGCPIKNFGHDGIRVLSGITKLVYI